MRELPNGAPHANDATTSLEYEPYGEIKRVIEADGVGLEYCRDAAHRITAMVATTSSAPSRCVNGTAAGGTEAVIYTLDHGGNRIKEEIRDASGTVRRLIARQFNQIGQLRSLIAAPYAAQANLDNPSVKKTTLTYDAQGNADLTTDPLGRVSDQDFDPLNRLLQSIQDKDTPSNSGEVNATIKYEYNARDQLRKVTDPKNLQTEYIYDGLSNQTRLSLRSACCAHRGPDSRASRRMAGLATL